MTASVQPRSEGKVRRLTLSIKRLSDLHVQVAELDEAWWTNTHRPDWNDKHDAWLWSQADKNEHDFGLVSKEWPAHLLLNGQPPVRLAATLHELPQAVLGEWSARRARRCTAGVWGHHMHQPGWMQCLPGLLSMA